jgi:hypothetical protein
VTVDRGFYWSWSLLAAESEEAGPSGFTRIPRVKKISDFEAIPTP